MKLRITKKEPLIDYAILKTDPELRMLFPAEVRNKFEALEGLDDIEQLWENLKEGNNKADQEIIPKVKKKQNRNG